MATKKQEGKNSTCKPRFVSSATRLFLAERIAVLVIVWTPQIYMNERDILQTLKINALGGANPILCQSFQETHEIEKNWMSGADFERPTRSTTAVSQRNGFCLVCHRFRFRK